MVTWKKTQPFIKNNRGEVLFKQQFHYFPATVLWWVDAVFESIWKYTFHIQVHTEYTLWFCM